MYVPDVDAVVARAVASGARIVRPVETRFYGDRLGQIEDPFGHLGGCATYVEDVPAEEIQRRAESTMAETLTPAWLRLRAAGLQSDAAPCT